jgi:predicted ABC-type ATPase
MSEPTLLVVAGCNGSGKSSFSKLLAPNFLPFDYDIQFLNFYKKLLDIDIREDMAHNQAFAEFTKQIDLAIGDKSNFCYETNFNSSPLHWPELFKKNGYKLHLIYLCLESTEEANKRVAIRVENGGHYVSENEIKTRYFDGFANLNSSFRYFDIVDIFDTSAYAAEPKHVLSIENGIATIKGKLPNYLGQLIPLIAAGNK